MLRVSPEGLWTALPSEEKVKEVPITIWSWFNESFWGFLAHVLREQYEWKVALEVCW